MIVDPVHSNSSQRDTRRACEESGKFWRREVGKKRKGERDNEIGYMSLHVSQFLREH